MMEWTPRRRTVHASLWKHMMIVASGKSSEYFSALHLLLKTEIIKDRLGIIQRRMARLLGQANIGKCSIQWNKIAEIIVEREAVPSLTVFLLLFVFQTFLGEIHTRSVYAIVLDL